VPGYEILDRAFMSEFKFACPVCGQHISTDSATSGTEVDCPTCFRRIVIPQAPSLADTRLILTAVQHAKPRPMPSGLLATPQPAARHSRWPGLILLFLIAAAAVAAWILWGDRIWPR